MAFSSGVMRYFYPRPPRGRRRENIQCEAKLLAISIHALREEGDDVLPVWCRLWGLFLSTPSARRATFCGGSGGSGWPISIHALREEGDAYEPFHLREKIEISIHALREEGDPLQSPPCALLSNFYPRPPRGGRQSALSQVIAAAQFLSTPSARRATCPLPTTTRSARFLSTPSARRATSDSPASWQSCCISIHALREEGDLLEVSQWAM